MSRRSASGPVRGLQTLEPYMLPPCGIRIDRKVPPRSAGELLAEGLTPRQLREEWGFRAVELARSGVSARDLMDAGVPTSEIANVSKYTLVERRDAGCTAFQLMGAGLRADQLKRAGYGPSDFLAAGLSTGAVRALGFSVEDMELADSMPPPPPTSSSRRRARARPMSAGVRSNRVQHQQQPERPQTACTPYCGDVAACSTAIVSTPTHD